MRKEARHTEGGREGEREGEREREGEKGVFFLSVTVPNRSKSSPPPFYAKVLKKTKKVGLSHLPSPC